MAFKKGYVNKSFYVESVVQKEWFMGGSRLPLTTMKHRVYAQKCLEGFHYRVLTNSADSLFISGIARTLNVY